MLDLKNNRVDFGETLSPPEGFETDFAVGTTYSLDFSVLASACMSLGLSVSMDSNIKEAPLFLFHVLEKMKDKVLMFCQKGEIHNRGSQNELWIMLENVIRQVTPPGSSSSAHPVFHPKFWLIRYKEKNGKRTSHRIIVSSRNCTDSKDWDITVSLDSKPGNGAEKNASIRDFIKYLTVQLNKDKLEKGSKNKKRLEELSNELSHVVFNLDSSNFDDYEFIPSGIEGYHMSSVSPFKKGHVANATETFDRLLVISPFLSKGGGPISRFNTAARDKRRNVSSDSHDETNCILLTRAEELHKLKPEDCDNFSLWITQPEVITEDELDSESPVVDSSESPATEIGKPLAPEASILRAQQDNSFDSDANASLSSNGDIHAKVYMVEKNSSRNLYLGSLNASAKALHQNIEILLKLRMKGYRQESFYDVVLRELFGDDTPFERVQIQDYQVEPEENEEQNLRTYLDGVIRSIKCIRAEVSKLGEQGQETRKPDEQEDLYRLTLAVELMSNLCTIESSGVITISPLLISHGRAQQLETATKKQTVEFSDLEKLSLSQFVRVSVSSQGNKNAVSRVLKVDTMTGLPDREGVLLGKLIRNNREEFLTLAEFMLSDNPERTLLESRLAQHSATQGKVATVFGNELYESMLKTAYSDPDRLRNMKRTLDLLPQNESDQISEKLKELIDAFCKAVK